MPIITRLEMNSTVNQISVFFFSMILVGMIFIPSQSQLAFAGSGLYEDKDRDGFSPVQGDCNDNDKSVYPGNGCDPAATVKYAIEYVKDLIEDWEFDINDGQAGALLKILRNAINQLESENTNAAAGLLNAFIKQIDKYIDSGHLSSQDGEELIISIQHLIDAL